MTGIALVTGSEGFIGRSLVALLQQHGIPVRTLDLEAPKAPAGGRAHWQGSITDWAMLQAAMEGVSTVYHLASGAQLWAFDAQAMIQGNEEGTRLVLEAAQKAGVRRVVHTSTEAILQSRKGSADRKLLDETIQPPEAAMCGAYCVAKLRAERVAVEGARQGIPVVIVNPSAPIGPGDPHLTPPTRMLLGYLNGDFPGYLETVLNLVDVRDVALGHLRAAERGQTGERYLLGHTNIAMEELLNLLAQLTGLSMPRFRVPYWLAYFVSGVEELRARAGIA